METEIETELLKVVEHFVGRECVALVYNILSSPSTGNVGSMLLVEAGMLV
jgi:hypothetical protein